MDLLSEDEIKRMLSNFKEKNIVEISCFLRQGIEILEQS